MNFRQFFRKKMANDKRQHSVSNLPRVLRSIYSGQTTKRRNRKFQLKDKIDKSGIDMSSVSLGKLLMVFCVVLNLGLTAYAVTWVSSNYGLGLIILLILVLFLWLFVFAVIVFIVWLLFYVALDVAIYKRTRALETVLPDFLQLASSNIRAGMTIEQALWYAVRPRFGVLAKDIEEVAKRTIAGEEFEDALQTFVKKYDSKVLARSISLLVEGVRAGGEIGELLDKISTNIQETSLMKKELAANVTTYIIFITFASVVAAPFLFGLAYQLISVIQHIFSRVDMSGGASSGMAFNISSGAVELVDFQIFAMVSLAITSFFSGLIVSTIKTGSAHGTAKYFPTFLASSVVLFFIIIRVFSMMLGGVF